MESIKVFSSSLVLSLYVVTISHNHSGKSGIKQHKGVRGKFYD
jgi:hypothetical protein